MRIFFASRRVMRARNAVLASFKLVSLRNVAAACRATRLADAIADFVSRSAKQ